MKNIAFFITHKTLDKGHAELSLFSMSKQIINNKKLDCLYIYNTHQDELSNSVILGICEKYNLNRVVDEIKIFDYKDTTVKCLGADVQAISEFSIKNFSGSDRILIWKSDCILSVNYLDDILNIPPGDISFIAPFICAKERINDDEILDYSNRKSFIRSDDITFFVENHVDGMGTDFQNRHDINVTNKQIKFTSCYVITDFSCHFISVRLLNRIKIDYSSWGGAKFYNLTDKFIGTDRSFVIHKYHGIISVNRNTDREGPVKEWLTS